MSQNQSISAIMKSVGDRMKADFEASQAVTHRGARGTSREEIAKRFIAQHLPHHMTIEQNAELISCDGRVSRQCDLAIYDRSAPNFLDLESYRILPTESVYGIVEVKSNLTRSDLLDACENLRSAKELRRTAFSSGPSGNQMSGPFEQRSPVGIIFAFNGPHINTTVKTMWEWARSVQDPNLWPDCIWVLGKGSLAWIGPGEGADPLPSPWSHPMSVMEDSESSILLHAAIQLNVIFSGAVLRPVDLRAYADELGTIGFVTEPLEHQKTLLQATRQALQARHDAS